MKSNNAVIIFITPSKRILLVRSKKSWGVPGGRRDGKESDYECALREFREETSFSIEPEFINSLTSHKRHHINGTTTKIYIIQSTQQFPAYDPNKVLHRETDSLVYLKLSDLYKLIFNNIPHGKVDKLRQSNFNSLKELFIQGIISK